MRLENKQTEGSKQASSPETRKKSKSKQIHFFLKEKIGQRKQNQTTHHNMKV